MMVSDVVRDKCEKQVRTCRRFCSQSDTFSFVGGDGGITLASTIWSALDTDDSCRFVTISLICAAISLKFAEFVVPFRISARGSVRLDPSRRFDDLLEMLGTFLSGSTTNFCLLALERFMSYTSYMDRSL